MHETLVDVLLPLIEIDLSETKKKVKDKKKSTAVFEIFTLVIHLVRQLCIWLRSPKLRETVSDYFFKKLILP